MMTAQPRTPSSDTKAGTPDDIETYIATFSEDERRELTAAEAAIDIAILLNRARRQRGLSQTEAAQLAGLKQQAISRFERPDANSRLETVQAYLGALGFALELNVVDAETGDIAATVVLPAPTSHQQRDVVHPNADRRGKRGVRSLAPTRSG